MTTEERVRRLERGISLVLLAGLLLILAACSASTGPSADDSRHGALLESWLRSAVGRKLEEVQAVYPEIQGSPSDTKPSMIWLRFAGLTPHRVRCVGDGRVLVDEVAPEKRDLANAGRTVLRVLSRAEPFSRFHNCTLEGTTELMSGSGAGPIIGFCLVFDDRRRLYIVNRGGEFHIGSDPS